MKTIKFFACAVVLLTLSSCVVYDPYVYDPPVVYSRPAPAYAPPPAVEYRYVAPPPPAPVVVQPVVPFVFGGVWVHGGHGGGYHHGGGHHR